MTFLIILSLILSFLINLFSIFLARKYKLIDDPKGKKLKIHRKPVLISGGIGIVFSTLAIISFFLIDGKMDLNSYQKILVYLFFPSLIIAIFGIVDDIKHLKPVVRLTYQSVASIFVLLMIIEKFSLLEVVFITISTILILGIISATNMTDGMDGLCGAMVLITLLSYFYLSTGQTINLYFLCLILSILVFLVFNFNPAKIFLGNSGSEFLGFSVGIFAIYLIFSSTKFIQILFIISMVGVPLIDMLFSIVRRLINHQPITSGDRNHIYDRMLKKGFSQKKVWLILTIYQILINTSLIYFYLLFE